MLGPNPNPTPIEEPKPESKIRRINVFAGPGAGKSTLAAKIFGEMKVRGHDVEHISEYIKTWAHQGRLPVSFDQVYVFAKQMHAEDTALQNVKYVVTDCPLLMCCAYGRFYGFHPYVELTQIAKHFDEVFPAINLLIDRTVDYNEAGRYQSLKEAKEFDGLLLDTMAAHCMGGFHKVRVDDFDSVLSTIEHRLGLE